MATWKEEDYLTGFLFLCVICHGMFFAREWVVLGIIFITYRLFSYGKTFRSEMISDGTQSYFNPVMLFPTMILLSLTGLFHPVRSVEGWLEALRWLVFLTAFLWGRELALTIESRDRILNRILWVALIGTIITWLPGSEFIWMSPGSPEAGRFASSFGYPNAAAVFFGCQLLLLQKEKKTNGYFLIVFAICLVSTGSRAATLMLLFFYGILAIKKKVLSAEKDQILTSKQLGFYKRAAWEDWAAGIVIILLFQYTLLYFQGSYQHLFDWTDTSLNERVVYYFDSIKIAWYANFLPQAGGWFAFPFVQTLSYWALDPHSSFCRILLNQGLAGIVLLGIWLIKGVIGYCKDLIWGKDLTVICTKTAALYLGLHSLIDVDMSFGALGILFWLLVGMNSK